LQNAGAFENRCFGGAGKNKGLFCAKHSKERSSAGSSPGNNHKLSKGQEGGGGTKSKHDHKLLEEEYEDPFLKAPEKKPGGFWGGCGGMPG